MHHVVNMAKQQYGEIDDVTIPRINYDINNVYLQVVPYADDLSNTMIFPPTFDTQICATYKYYLGRDANNIRSIPITPKIFDTYFSMYNLGDFFRIAQNNTRRLFPLNIRKLDKEWELTHKQMGYSVEESQDKISRLTKHDYVYAVTTPERVYGANIFLMPELLTSFSSDLESSLFIIPTLDMVFLFSAHNPIGSDLTEFVKKINDLDPENYLSDQLYYFNYHTGTLHIYK